MDSTSTLGLLGLGMPTPAYSAGLILFSILGLATYRYGLVFLRLILLTSNSTLAIKSAAEQPNAAASLRIVVRLGCFSPSSRLLI